MTEGERIAYLEGIALDRLEDSAGVPGVLGLRSLLTSGDAFTRSRARHAITGRQRFAVESGRARRFAGPLDEPGGGGRVIEAQTLAELGGFVAFWAFVSLFVTVQPAARAIRAAVGRRRAE